FFKCSAREYDPLSLRAKRSNPFHNVWSDGLLRRVAPRNDEAADCRSSCHPGHAKMPVQNLFRRLDHIDPLAVAAAKGQHGAFAVAPHTADEWDVDVDRLPRLEPRALNPEAHMISLSRRRMRDGASPSYSSARNSRAAATMLASAGRTSSHLRVFNPQSGL